MGDDVGSEKASCVEERACPFLTVFELSAVNSEESQPIAGTNGWIARNSGDPAAFGSAGRSSQTIT